LPRRRAARPASIMTPMPTASRSPPPSISPLSPGAHADALTLYTSSPVTIDIMTTMPTTSRSTPLPDPVIIEAFPAAERPDLTELYCRGQADSHRRHLGSR